MTEIAASDSGDSTRLQIAHGEEESNAEPFSGPVASITKIWSLAVLAGVRWLVRRTAHRHPFARAWFHNLDWFRGERRVTIRESPERRTAPPFQPTDSAVVPT